jgi:hypothetical protein
MYAEKWKYDSMTVDEYRTQYNPHYSINDKIYENKIDCKSKEYFDDKERRLCNFRLYGRFEPCKSYSKLTENVKLRESKAK